MFCKKATRLALSHVVDKVIVKERLTVNGSARSKEFTIELAFYPKTQYQAEYDVEPSEILAVFGTKFPLLLKKELQAEMKKLDAELKNQMKELGKGTAVRDVAPSGRGEAGEEDADETGDRRTRKDDDDASEVGDGDATAAKRQRQGKEQATYEDDEEEDEEAVALGEYDDADIEAAFASASEEEDEGMDVDEDTEQAHARKRLDEEVSRVEGLFIQNLPSTTSLSFCDSGCSIRLQVRATRDINCSLEFTSTEVRFLHAKTPPCRDSGEDLC